MLPQTRFLKSFPDAVMPHLPARWQGIQSRQPFQWLVQFHFGEPALHYELSRAWSRPGWELGLHCEARDAHLNRFLLMGFRRHLFEIKDTLGPAVEAEMWVRGWTKVYEVHPETTLTTAYQEQLARRLAAMIDCLQPILIDWRSQVTQVYR